MISLLFLIAALLCFAIEFVADAGGADLVALGLAFLAVAFILNHKRLAGRVP